MGRGHEKLRMRTLAISKYNCNNYHTQTDFYSSGEIILAMFWNKRTYLKGNPSF